MAIQVVKQYILVFISITIYKTRNETSKYKKIILASQECKIKHVHFIPILCAQLYSYNF